MLKNFTPVIVAAILFSYCSPNKPSPLFLTILVPHDGDTVRMLIDSVEGKTYSGARVAVGFAQNSPNNITLVPDDTGRFIGTYQIPTDQPGSYSVYISASYQGLTITETRTVNYVRQ